MGRFSSYSGLNFAVRPSSSLSTACATATPPSPPFSHTSHSSTPTPSAAHSSRTASSSASPSFTNRLSATTTGTPNFCTFLDRKSTRLNSSHGYISYAVFCLKKKKLGRSATEFARGRYDPTSQLLLLQGYRKEDPDTVIGLDGYRLLVANGGDALVGITDDGGTGEGRFSARRVPGSDSARGPIIGSYALYLLTNPAGARVSSMSITSGSADGFHISGNDGSGWMGDGRMDGVEGFYEWRFNDGRTGRTTIVVHSDGTLRGHVSGSGLDWWYLAVPVRSLPQKE